MSFKNIRFPTGIRYGAVMGPQWLTAIARLPSGKAKKNRGREFPMRRFRVERALSTDALRNAFWAFVYNMDGPLNTFRIKDASDFEVATGEGVFDAFGSPSGSQYQLQKRYTSGAYTKDIDVVLPVSGSLAVFKSGGAQLVENTHYTVDYTTPSGLITMIGSPLEVPASWTGEYDILAAFESDEFMVQAADADVWFAQNITILEERP